MKLHFRLYNDAKKPIFAFKIIDRKKGQLRFNAYTINKKNEYIIKNEYYGDSRCSCFIVQ